MSTLEIVTKEIVDLHEFSPNGSTGQLTVISLDHSSCRAWTKMSCSSHQKVTS